MSCSPNSKDAAVPTAQLRIATKLPHRGQLQGGNPSGTAAAPAAAAAAAAAAAGSARTSCKAYIQCNHINTTPLLLLLLLLSR
jgi:hypothetical protein